MEVGAIEEFHVNATNMNLVVKSEVRQHEAKVVVKSVVRQHEVIHIILVGRLPLIMLSNSDECISVRAARCLFLSLVIHSYNVQSRQHSLHHRGRERATEVRCLRYCILLSISDHQ